jgi:anaerobic magnesium-protoporphyrin IX monomethyl ester cyclase
MKILLINPTIDGAGELYHPGLASLATYLNHQGKHTARILDFVYHEWEWKSYLKRKLEKIQPDIIGITATTPKMPSILQIMREVKKHKNYPILLGGHHPSLESEGCLELPEVDYIAIGESEFYLEELLDHLEAGKSIQGIKGIWGKEKGEIIRNELGNLPNREQLDAMPDADWDLWEDVDEMIYATGYLPMMAVRGCAYDCTFCSSPFLRKRLEGTGPFVRGRSPEVCAQECYRLYHKFKKRGLRWLFFYDLNF